MKLSEIVSYLEFLESLQVHDQASEAVDRLVSVVNVVTGHAVQVSNCSQDIEQKFESLKFAHKNFGITLAEIKQCLIQMLHEQEPAYLAESFRLFNQEMRHDSLEYILNRRLAIDDISNIKLRSRLKNLANWQLPGLVIAPRTETFVEDIVPLDPLYLVDIHQNLLDITINRFPLAYQRRLRQYVVNNDLSNGILDELPSNQFGVIFAYNYFNYFPMELITQYLQEITTKLRPGGSFIMTYNNCDRSHGIALAEKSWMCYTPGRLLIQAANSAGLEHVSSTDASGNLSWIEFARPGKIESIRGGQSLAKIIAIPQ